MIIEKNAFSFNKRLKIQLVFLTFIFICSFLYSPSSVYPQIEKRKDMLPWTVQITFGIRGPKPLIWDGMAIVPDGKIENMKSINFTEGDALYPEENRWVCQINRLRGREMAEKLDVFSPREYLEEWVAKGIILELKAPRTTTLSFDTAGGVFSFNIEDLELGKPIARLDKNIEIRLLPRSFILTSEDKMNNYSAITVDSTGNIWTAYVSYDMKEEQLVLRKYDGDTWGEEIEISNTGCFLKPSLAADSEGRVWVCWSARIKDNWDIFARYYKNGRWSKNYQLSDHPGPEINQRILVDENNRLWACWQGFQSKYSDIFMKYWDNGKWSSLLKVTESQGNDWQPAITTDNRGNIYCAYEAFRNKRHALLLRQFNINSSAFGQEIEVASSKYYIGHASLAADKDGRVWIAWDISEDDWGFGEDEEQRFIEIGKFDSIETEINYNKEPMEGRRGRYNSRKMGLICYYGGKFYEPVEDFASKFKATMQIYADIPQLQIDANGRLWLFFHHYSGKIPFYIHDKVMEVWKVYGIFYDGKAWSSPIELGYTTWRNIYASSSCAGTEKAGIWITYAGDNRQKGSRELDPTSICVTSINLEKLPLQQAELIPSKKQPKIFTETSANKAVPAHAIQYESDLGTIKYKLFWGTVHEQHDTRGRMGMDCFVVDAFKYALDDQQYNFLGVADYALRENTVLSRSFNYSLWEAKKATSIYSNGDYFLSFYVKGKSPYKRAPGHSLQKKPIPKGMAVITCVYAEDYTPESFIDSLQNRRNYLATDWIVLDFTVEGQPIGSKFLGSNPNPRCLAKIIGTGDIEQVDIIRNAKAVYSSTNFTGNEAEITFVDMDLPVKDDYHYFIQLKQKDGGMAWTPPICYHYKPKVASK
ncbi:MAG: hypothetical protein ACMUIP_03430 [bacterium]